MVYVVQLVEGLLTFMRGPGFDPKTTLTWNSGLYIGNPRIWEVEV